MPGEVRTLIVEVLGRSKEAVGALAEVDKAAGKSEGAFASLGAVGAKMAGAIGVGLVGVGVLAVKMADEQEAAHAKLNAAIQTTGGTYVQYKKQIDAVVQSGTAFGYNSAQIQDAIATMTPGFHGAGNAIKELGVAEDLAKFKHMDLAQAALLVTKAHEGQIKPMKQLGIDLPLAAGGALKVEKATVALAKAQENYAAVLAKVHTDHQGHVQGLDAVHKATEKITAAQDTLNTAASTGDQIMAELGRTVSGQASAAADTFGGKIAALKAQGENWLAMIGQKLIPVITELSSKLLDGVQWLQKHRDVVMLIAAAIGGVLVPVLVIAAVAAIGLYGPMIAGAAAMAAMGAAVMYAWQHWKTFHDVVEAVGLWLKGTFLPWIEELWTNLKLGVAILVKWVQDHWQQIQAVTSQVWGFIKDYVLMIWSVIHGVVKTAMDNIHGVITIVGDILTGKWSRLWDDMKNTVARVFGDIVRSVWDILQRVGTVLMDIVPNMLDWGGKIGKGIIDGIVNFIQNAPHALMDAIKGLVSGIPGGNVLLSGLAAFHVPGFATGGIVPGPIGSPSLAIVHGGETITPAGRGGGPTYMIGPIYASGTREGELAGDAVVSAIVRYERANGADWRS